VDLRNNVIYNWGNNSTYGGEGGHFNLVNNYYKQGPSSKDRKYFVDAYGVYTSTCKVCDASNIEEGYPELYLSGNVYAQYDSMSNGPEGIYWHNGQNHSHYGKTLSSALPISGKDGELAYVTTHSAREAVNVVCEYAGASYKRDEVDSRVSADVKNGTGCLVKDIADVKAAYGIAWPEYKVEKGAGFPDWLTDENASEYTIDPQKRYTNLEMYLHYLVRDIVAGGNEKGSYVKL